jgi:hypothetical protein
MLVISELFFIIAMILVYSLSQDWMILRKIIFLQVIY